MKNVVMVIAPDVFRDEEYAVPKGILTDAGVTVTTASDPVGLCHGKLGMVVESSISPEEAATRAWDAVVFVGGAGAAQYFDDPHAWKLAREVFDSGGIVSAICIGPSTLAHAGLLAGVTATAFPSQREDLIEHGALWTEEPVVSDGRIVTANGPESADDFGRELVYMLDS